MADLKLLDDVANSKLLQRVDAASNKLDNVISAYSSKLESAKTKLERVLRAKDKVEEKLAYLQSSVSSGALEANPMQESVYQNAIKKYEDLIPGYQQEIRKYAEMHNSLNDLGGLANKDPQQFLKQLEYHGDLLTEVKPLQDMRGAVADLITKRTQISKAISPNIGNDKSFIMEYLTRIAPRPKNDIVKMHWMLNPQNQAKLEVLHDPKYLGFAKKVINKRFSPEQIAKGNVPQEVLDLANQPSASIAKKLGIGVAAAASLIPILKVYSWLGNSEATNIRAEVTGSIDDINNFSSAGMGASIVKNLKTALQAEESAYQKVIDASKTGNADTTQQAIQTYIATQARTQDVLNKSIKNWDSVVRSADKPEIAKSTMIGLQALQTKMQQRVDTLGKEMGVSTSGGGEIGFTGQKPAPMSRKPNAQDIANIQDFLSNKNPDVGQTGILDRETVRTLKALEQEYNRRDNSDKFTGLLVDQSKGHVMRAEDLKMLDETMKKYK